MTATGKHFDRGAWAVGGGTLIGLGVGFIFIQTSIFSFIASLLIGIGAGLLVAALLPKGSRSARLRRMKRRTVTERVLV